MMGSRLVMAVLGRPFLMASSTCCHCASRGPARREKFIKSSEATAATRMADGKWQMETGRGRSNGWSLAEIRARGFRIRLHWHWAVGSHHFQFQTNNPPY